ncbi:MAG: nucleoside-diphosphate kinase [Bacillota bacterium]
MVERTLVLLKPDTVARGLCGEIISRFEKKGLRLAGMKLMQVDEALARKHYAMHEGKPFFQGLIEYITALPIVAMVWEGPNAIANVRAVMGATDPAKAQPGTIRGDYGLDISNNLVHGSDSEESAKREIALFFKDDEVLSWERPQEKYITG